jgi:hypothetical protein
MSAQTYSIFTAVTPSATAPNVYKALYIGGAGNVDVEQRGSGITASFKAVPVGTILPINTMKVLATTGATLIIGMN